MGSDRICTVVEIQASELLSMVQMSVVECRRVPSVFRMFSDLTREESDRIRFNLKSPPKSDLYRDGPCVQLT